MQAGKARRTRGITFRRPIRSFESQTKKNPNLGLRRVSFSRPFLLCILPSSRSRFPTPQRRISFILLPRPLCILLYPLYPPAIYISMSFSILSLLSRGYNCHLGLWLPMLYLMCFFISLYSIYFLSII
ncbi:uncharacterized protein VTP21DRAFT_955 [Calcarisporiella thermophila]|uniref:uncharacterized protein n=1 Tax=Calcarisporiella thermophila TaxID=911321 RepID=UPI003744813A